MGEEEGQRPQGVVSVRTVRSLDPPGGYPVVGTKETDHATAYFRRYDRLTHCRFVRSHRFYGSHPLSPRKV